MEVLEDIIQKSLDTDRLVILSDVKTINRNTIHERETFSYYIELNKKKLKLNDGGTYKITIEKIN